MSANNIVSLKIKNLSRPLRRERIKPRVGAFFFCADIADNADTAGSWFVSVRMRPEVGRPSNTGTHRPTGERRQAGLRRATDAPSCARQAHGEEYGHPREDAVTGQTGPNTGSQARATEGAARSEERRVGKEGRSRW